MPQSFWGLQVSLARRGGSCDSGGSGRMAPVLQVTGTHQVGPEALSQRKCKKHHGISMGLGFQMKSVHLSVSIFSLLTFVSERILPGHVLSMMVMSLEKSSFVLFYFSCDQEGSRFSGAWRLDSLGDHF